MISAASTAGASAVVEAAESLTGAIDNVTSAQKNRIETKLLKRTLADVERRVSVASLDDVERYDPRVERLRGAVGRAKNKAVAKIACRKAVKKVAKKVLPKRSAGKGRKKAAKRR